VIRNHAKSIKKDEIMMCGFVSIICADILNGNEISALLATTSLCLFSLFFVNVITAIFSLGWILSWKKCESWTMRFSLFCSTVCCKLKWRNLGPKLFAIVVISWFSC